LTRLSKLYLPCKISKDSEMTQNFKRKCYFSRMLIFS
jgi:hypothetical protein